MFCDDIFKYQKRYNVPPFFSWNFPLINVFTELKFPGLFYWLKQSFNRLSGPFVHDVSLLLTSELFQWVEDTFSDDESRESGEPRDGEIKYYLHCCRLDCRLKTVQWVLAWTALLRPTRHGGILTGISPHLTLAGSFYHLWLFWGNCFAKQILKYILDFINVLV